MAIKLQGQLIADSDIELNTVTDDIAFHLNYQDTILTEKGPVPNQETKADFVIRQASEYLVRVTNERRLFVATQEAENAVIKVSVQK